MKIRTVATELFHADGRTDGHEEANSRFMRSCERTYEGSSNMTPRLLETLTKSLLLDQTRKHFYC